MRERMILLVLVAALVWAAPARAQSSPYSQLGADKLAEALSRRGMTELLDALTASLTVGGKDSIEATLILAKQLLAQARQEGQDPDKALLLRLRAAAAYKAVAEKTKEKFKEIYKKGDKIDRNEAQFALQHMDHRFAWANTVGIEVAQESAQKLIDLEGGDEDRAIIAKNTQEAAELFAALGGEIDELMGNWRLNNRLLVWAVPELETRQAEIKYKSAWVYLYSGMSLPDRAQAAAMVKARQAALKAAQAAGKNDEVEKLRREIEEITVQPEERRVRLEDAVRAVETWAQGDAESGVKYWSLLLIGMANREMGLFGEAEKALKLAATAVNAEKKPDGEVRAKAWWNMARAQIESGKYAEGLKAIDEYRAEIMGLLGKKGAYFADLKASLLQNYLYTAQAEKQKDKAAALREEAVMALLRVPAKHSDWAMTEHWAGIVRRKYGESARGNAAVLYAGVLGPLGEWRTLALAGKKASAPVKKKVFDGLGTLVEGKGKSYEYLRPLALWWMAQTKLWDGDNLEAGKLFLRIAVENKAHPLARTSAMNACKLYRQLIQNRISANSPVDPNFRRALLQAAGVFVDGWVKGADGAWDLEVAIWYEDIGTQNQRLVGSYTAAEPKGNSPAAVAARIRADQARMLQAVAAYEKLVDRAQPGVGLRMRARHAGLELRYAWGLEQDKIGAALGGEDPQAKQWARGKKAWATALVQDLAAYGKDAKQAVKDIPKALAQIEADLAKPGLKAAEKKELSRRKDGLAELRTELPEAGSLAEFRAGQLSYEVLQQEAPASRLMRELPARWPDTKVIVNADEFLIRMDILRDRIDDAILKLDLFKKKWVQQPEKYRQMVATIIRQLSDKIKELRGRLQGNRADLEAKEQLPRYRASFHRFALTLYSPVKDKDLADRYDLTKLYATGLLEKGAAERDAGKKDAGKAPFEEALELLKACEALVESRRDAEGKVIEKELAEWLKGIGEIQTIEQARKAHADYRKTLKDKTGIVPSADPRRPDRISGPAEVAGALAYVEDAAKSVDPAKDAPAIAERIPTFRRKLETALRQIAALRMEWRALDEDVVLGLARANRNLDRYEEASKYYKLMLNGIDPVKLPRLYWSTELEYCRSLFHAYRRDKAKLTQLLSRLRSLQANDTSMGGLASEFQALEADVREALEAMK